MGSWCCVGSRWLRGVVVASAAWGRGGRQVLRGVEVAGKVQHRHTTLSHSTYVAPCVCREVTAGKGRLNEGDYH